MRVIDLKGEIVFPSPIHKCCDVCESECPCQTCSHSSPVSLSHTGDTDSTIRGALSHQKQVTLQQLLMAYRNGQCDATQPLLLERRWLLECLMLV